MGKKRCEFEGDGGQRRSAQWAPAASTGLSSETRKACLDQSRMKGQGTEWMRFWTDSLIEELGGGHVTREETDLWKGLQKLYREKMIAHKPKGKKIVKLTFRKCSQSEC